MPYFELEVYWGSLDGTLWHDTITVQADNFERAYGLVMTNRLMPEGAFPACSRELFFEDHFDVEPLWEVLVSNDED